MDSGDLGVGLLVHKPVEVEHVLNRDYVIILHAQMVVKIVQEDEGVGLHAIELLVQVRFVVCDL